MFFNDSRMHNNNFGNAILEGIMFQFILVGSLVIVSVLIADLSLFFDSLLFVVFVIGLNRIDDGVDVFGANIGIQFEYTEDTHGSYQVDPRFH